MNPIETLAVQIQELPASIRWFHAQEDVIAATARGFQPLRGPRMGWIDRLVRIFNRLGLGRELAASVNLLFLIGIYIAQFRVRASTPDGRFLFVGIGALREPALAELFERSFGCVARHLSAFDPKSFYFQRIPLAALCSEWIAVWREIWSARAKGGSPQLIEQRYCLGYIMASGHSYIFSRAWFRAYGKATGFDRAIGFTVANQVAFAAIAVGMRGVHLQHGFQARSLIYPDFSEVFCGNRFDAEHAVRRLAHAVVRIVPENFASLETRRGVAIAGGYLESDGFDLCRSLIEWAQSCGVPVYVRMHPRDSTGYWDRWQGVDGVEIVDTDCDFNEFLVQFRPRILATWYSTTVQDALARGVVPVTFLPSEHPAVANTVFPIRDVALRWPEQRMLIQAVLDDARACHDLAAERFLDVLGEQDGKNSSDTEIRGNQTAREAI